MTLLRKPKLENPNSVLRRLNATTSGKKSVKLHVSMGSQHVKIVLKHAFAVNLAGKQVVDFDSVVI